jgi:hypothetical protein
MKGITMNSEDMDMDIRRAAGQVPEAADAGAWQGFAKRVFDDLTAALRDGRTLEDGERMVLAVAMRDRLALRDAVILLAVDGGDADAFTGFAVRPHETSNRLRDSLTRMFECARWQCEPTRIEGMTRIMLDVAEHAPGEYAAQPFAVAAYLMWATGDEACATLALHALVADGDCTLAAMMLAAQDRGVYPAHCSR